MELQTAAHFATLVTMCIVVVAAIFGLPALWWKRRKQNQRIMEALEYMRPYTEISEDLIKVSIDTTKDLLSKEQFNIVNAQLLSVIALLEKSYRVQFWHFALTHSRTSELPDWLKRKLGHDED